MFLVGGSHGELLIGGPAAGVVVALEGAASAGQILLSSDAAAQLPRGCLGAQVGDGVLLARSPAPGDWSPTDWLAEPSAEAIAECLSTTVRGHVLGGHAAPEHRTATISFLQFGQLDRLLAQQGVEAAAERLDEVVRLVQDACDRYDVCFLDSDIAPDGAKIRLSAPGRRR